MTERVDLRTVRVWEWPLRVWHWLFALAVSFSLITGLSGDIGWMDWHLRSGYTACALLVFRVIWGFAGGPYSRWSAYRTTPARIVAYFKGHPKTLDGLPAPVQAHTPPGILLALAILLVVGLQALSGLGATDEIFVEGPLVRYLDDEWVDLANAVHHRAYYLVLALIAVHLTAHLVYAARRDPLPLSMITGRKRLPEHLADAPTMGLEGLIVGGLSAVAVWGALGWPWSG